MLKWAADADIYVHMIWSLEYVFYAGNAIFKSEAEKAAAYSLRVLPDTCSFGLSDLHRCMHTHRAAQTQTVLASTVHLYPHLDEDTLVCREQSRNAAKLDRRGGLKSQE